MDSGGDPEPIELDGLRLARTDLFFKAGLYANMTFIFATLKSVFEAHPDEQNHQSGTAAVPMAVTGR